MEEKKLAVGSLSPFCVQVLSRKMLLTTGVLWSEDTSATSRCRTFSDREVGAAPAQRPVRGSSGPGAACRPWWLCLGSCPKEASCLGSHLKEVSCLGCFGDLFWSWHSWVFHYENRVCPNSQLRVNTRLGGVKRMLYRWSMKHSGLLFNFHGFGNDI